MELIKHGHACVVLCEADRRPVLLGARGPGTPTPFSLLAPGDSVEL